MEITVSRLRRIMELTRGAIGPGIAQFVLCKDGLAISNNLDLAIAVELPELGDENFLTILEGLLNPALKPRKPGRKPKKREK